MLKKIIVEIPLSWFDNPIDGKKNKNFISNFLIQLSSFNIPLYLHSVPFGADNAPRTPEKGTLIFSYHSHSQEKNVWHLKEAPITPLYSIDASGYSGWAEISNSNKYDDYIGAQDLEEMRDVIKHYRDIFEANGISKYPQPENIDIEMPEKYVFFPLQVQNDPVSQFNNLNIMEMINKAAECALQYKTYLIFKRHPFCNSIAIDRLLSVLIRNNPYVKVLDLNIHFLIKNAYAVLTVNSGVGIEALVDGASVYASGRSEWYKASNPITSLEDIDGIFSEKPKKMNEYQEKLLGFLLSEYWVHPEDLTAIDQIIKNCIDDFDCKYGIDCKVNVAEVLTPIILDLQGRLEYEKRQAKLALMDIDALKKDNQTLRNEMPKLVNTADREEENNRLNEKINMLTEDITKLKLTLENKNNAVISIQNKSSDELSIANEKMKLMEKENLKLQEVIQYIASPDKNPPQAIVKKTWSLFKK